MSFSSNSSNTSDVASFGLVTFDGNGNLTMALKVNSLDGKGGRKTINLTGTGTYTVEADGTGVAMVKFKGIELESAYDFVITQLASEGKDAPVLAAEVFAVLRAGGIKGQLVAPVWKRRSD